jgi:hypothetical protein
MGGSIRDPLFILKRNTNGKLEHRSIWIFPSISKSS